MRICELFGIAIVVNPLFLLLLLGLAVVGQIPQTLILFGLVLWHESAHVIVARKNGLTVSEIELLPYGGVARIDELIQLDPPVEAEVALAGPLSNLVLLGLGWLVHSYYPQSEYWWQFFCYANIVMAGVNLLPALPLDGGRVLRSKLIANNGFHNATEKAANIGQVIAVCLMVVGLTSLWVYESSSSISLFVIGLFIFLSARKEKQNAMYIFMRYLTRKKQQVRLQRVLCAKELVATKETSIGEVLRYFTPPCYHLVWILDLDGELLGVITEIELINGLLEKGIHVKLSELVKYRMQ